MRVSLPQIGIADKMEWHGIEWRDVECEIK